MGSNNVKKLLSGFFIIVALVSIGTLIMYLSYVQKEVKVMVAKTKLPEGTTINLNNFDEYITFKKIKVSDYEKFNCLLYSDKNKRIIYRDPDTGSEKIGRQIIIERDKDDFIREKYFTIDMENGYISHITYALSKKYGKEYRGKYIELDNKTKLLAKGIQKGGNSLVTLKFIDEKNKEPYISERYQRVPIIDFERKKDKVTSITVAFTREQINSFDLEREYRGKMIVDFEPWKSTQFADNKNSSVWLKDIDKSFYSGENYSIKGEEKVTVSEIGVDEDE